MTPRPEDGEAAWTWTQFRAAMKAAGWRLRTREGWFEHAETGRLYTPFTWTREDGQAWREWAARRETPSKEDE